MYEVPVCPNFAMITLYITALSRRFKQVIIEFYRKFIYYTEN